MYASLCQEEARAGGLSSDRLRANLTMTTQVHTQLKKVSIPATGMFIARLYTPLKGRHLCAFGAAGGVSFDVLTQVDTL